jgi:uncharacterized membrane protein
MTLLFLGIVLFFGMHSISIVAAPMRDRLAARKPVGWRLFYAAISLIGIFLIIKGYADLRQSPTVLYLPPQWMRHIAALLMLPVFAFFIAPYFPGRIKTALKHPQLVAVKAWATAHLLVNGALADVLLFGSFLVWAVAARISIKRRPVRALPGAPASKMNDVIVVVIGLILYLVFAFWLHEWLFGVRPFA